MKFKHIANRINEGFYDDIPDYSERKKLGSEMCEDVMDYFDRARISYKEESGDVRVFKSKDWPRAVEFVKEYADNHGYTYRSESTTGLVVFNRKGSIFVLKSRIAI